MTTIAIVALGLAMGLVFGIALEKSRVMEPGVLIGQFQFRDFTMLKMFLAATATGLVVLAVLNGVFGVPLHVKAAVLGNVLAGGLLLGVGIVVAGACPGTALAQVGVGYRDAWAVVAGGLLGALFYGYNKPDIDAALDMGSWGKIGLADLVPLPFWALALMVAAAIAVLLVVMERMRPWRRDLQPPARTPPAPTRHDDHPGGVTA